MKDKTIEELMERREAIATEIDLPEADLDALMEEARAINEELERRKAEAEKRSNIRAAVAKKDGEKIVKETEKKMTIDEIRSMPEYVNAYANYIKTEDDRECRKILTQNGRPAGGGELEDTNGYIPVPTIVEGYIRTAWERNEILRRVRKTYVRGNLAIGFEISATGAYFHNEGDPAPEEETLQIGKMTIIPRSIKKWITISDEAMDMGGEDFLRYIVDEITYRIAAKAQNEILLDITAAPTVASATVPAVARVAQGANAMTWVSSAMSHLSPEATDLVVVTTREAWGEIKAAQAAANYAYDPFEGLPVVFVSNLPRAVTLIVGDFSRGIVMNFPNGEEIRVKRDDLSLAEADLVKFVGRMYVGIGLVASNMFTVIAESEGGGGNA
jgi:HK97 family phage major capsid protein